MKKIVFAAAMASVVISAPAMAANTASKDFDINATVAPECSIENPSNQSFKIEIDRTAGPNALKMTATEASSDRLWMSCNYNADIKVIAGALDTDATLAAADANDFTNKLVYDLVLENETKSNSGPFQKIAMKVSADNSTQTKTTTGAFHENAHLGVQIKPANNPLRPVAGAYTATVQIELGSI